MTVRNWISRASVKVRTFKKVQSYRNVSAGGRRFSSIVQK